MLSLNETLSQNETLTIVDPFGKFSINYSSDWEAIVPGHRFEEGNIDLIIQKPDRQQGYIEVRHEELPSEAMEESNKTNFLSPLNNLSLNILLSYSFQNYLSITDFQKVKQVEGFSYNKYVIPDLNTGSVVYSFEIDGMKFYGLYILSKNDYNILHISYTASANYYYKNIREAEKIISSFKTSL
jgi:hypothetical protein